MDAKHAIWCCGSLHIWKVFLPSQGITLIHATILSDIGMLDPMWQA